ncbi:MAG: hypothetical protein U9R74_19995 [Pseudomonadota bacterium]|nr:hypothetical protein [Pseudomonadota bacterium]
MKSPPTGMVGFMDPVTELDLATTLEPGTVGQAARASLDRVVDKLRQR